MVDYVFQWHYSKLMCVHEITLYGYIPVQSGPYTFGLAHWICYSSFCFVETNTVCKSDQTRTVRPYEYKQ